MVLQTPRLTLRPFTEKDVDLIAHHCNDPEVSRNTATIPFPYPREKAESFLAYTRNKNQSGGAVVGIVWNETDTLCGCIELGRNHEEQKHNRAELGYWIGRDFWGQGIATEAGLAMLAYGFDSLKLHKITSGYYDFNAGSARVQEKLGFKIEGVLRDQIERDGHYFALIKTGLLASEFSRR